MSHTYHTPSLGTLQSQCLKLLVPSQCQEAGTLKSQRYIKEVARVLKPGGSLYLISTGEPDIRLSYFKVRQPSFPH